MHRHLFFEIGLIFSGRCEWGIGDQTVIVSAGEAILVPPGQFHCEAVLDSPCTVAWLGFDTQRPMPTWVNRPIPLGEDLAEIHSLVQAVREEQSQAKRYSAERSALLTQSLLLLVTRQAEGPVPEIGSGPASPLNARQIASVESAAHYFRQNLTDCLSIAQVAAYHSLCPTYFSELFQRHHGVGPRAYLQKVRLERAAELLKDATLSVKEIARQCGFADSAHFCKVFRSHSRLTPTAFRRSLLKPVV